MITDKTWPIAGAKGHVSLLLPFEEWSSGGLGTTKLGRLEQESCLIVGFSAPSQSSWEGGRCDLTLDVVAMEKLCFLLADRIWTLELGSHSHLCDISL